jgi:uncharacterized protein (TIGR03435 family)
VLRICLGLVFVAAAWGQGGDEHLRFEVASVKPSPKHEILTNTTGGPGTSDPGRFRATNAELTWLVRRAYAIQSDQLYGPAWMDTTQFDVEAKVPPGTTAEQFRMMLQNLLAERFQLQVHHETRILAVYELMVAKNGPKLKPAAEGSGTDDFVPGSGFRRADRDGFPILPPGRSNFSCAHGPEGSHCTYRMSTMQQLAQGLTGRLDRRTIDKTALTGRYDFALYFRTTDGAPTEPKDDAPSIQQALREQLGLELVQSKASIDVLVIDHAERTPTEN